MGLELPQCELLTDVFHWQILAVLALLVRVIHFFPALAGLAVTLCLIPLSTAVANRLATIRKALMQQTDRRVKLCSEVVGGAPPPVQLECQ